MVLEDLEGRFVFLRSLDLYLVLQMHIRPLLLVTALDMFAWFAKQRLHIVAAQKQCDW